MNQNPSDRKDPYGVPYSSVEAVRSDRTYLAESIIGCSLESASAPEYQYNMEFLPDPLKAAEVSGRSQVESIYDFLYEPTVGGSRAKDNNSLETRDNLLY